MDFKEIIQKIKGDKKMLAIVLSTVVLIGLVIYLMVSKEKTNDQLANSDSNKVQDVLIPGSENIDDEKEDPNKVSLYDEYRKNSEKNNVQNSDDLFLFDKKDTAGMSEDEFEKSLNNRTSSLRNQYEKQTGSGGTSNKSTLRDFYPEKKSSNDNKQVKTEQPVVVAPVDTKRRKDLSGSNGNMNVQLNSKKINQETIQASVYNRGAAVKQGSSMKFRLNQELTIGSNTIPKNHIITGIVSFGNERVFIKFTSINYNGNILPVELEAYGSDGQKGIYSPNVISHDVAEKNISDALNQGKGKVNIPILGDVSIDIAKSHLKQQSVIVEDGIIIIIK